MNETMYFKFHIYIYNSQNALRRFEKLSKLSLILQKNPASRVVATAALFLALAYS